VADFVIRLQLQPDTDLDAARGDAASQLGQLEVVEDVQLDSADPESERLDPVSVLGGATLVLVTARLTVDAAADLLESVRKFAAKWRGAHEPDIELPDGTSGPLSTVTPEQLANTSG
jgi:hypothetical protein